MFRLRTLFFLFPLIILSQTTQIARAAPAAEKIPWPEGIYIGTISIDAHEYVSENPLPEGTLHEEHTLDILFSTGRMNIVVTKTGSMTVSFHIPIRFTYTDWDQVEDVGTGICEGKRTEARGRGSLLMFKSSASTGNTFTGKAQPFTVEGFTRSLRQFGKQCPDIPATRTQSEIESGFATMFGGAIAFEVKMTKGNIRAGYCYLPGYELEGDHAFDCTWYVKYFVPKKK